MTDNYTLDTALVTALPGEVHSELALWQERNKCKLHLIRALTSGYTDAFVGVVVADDETGSRKLVLKADRGDAADESKMHETALCNAPSSFARDHLVTQVFKPLRLGNGWFVMFQGVAGGGLTDYRPLSVYSSRTELGYLMPSIADSVINEWTASPKLQEVTLREFIELHVRKKLDEGGTLRDWATSLFGLQATQVPYLRFSASADPNAKFLNPFYIWNDSEWEVHKMHAVMGNIHGDLHLENVLVDVGEERNGSCKYRLIDLATYNDAGPLSRDFTNLYISEVERAIPDLDSDARSDLMRALSTGARDVSSKIHALSSLWEDLHNIADKETINRGYRDDWQRQVRLSLAGAALQSASRTHRAKTDRIWFLELAAKLLHDVCKGLHILPKSNEDHEIVLPEQELEVEIEAVATAVASACGQFTGECLTIAVVDGTEYHNHAQKISRFSAWDVVIDFDPFSDRGGLFQAAKDSDLKHRWLAENDGPASRSVSTLWLGAWVGNCLRVPQV